MSLLLLLGDGNQERVGAGSAQLTLTGSADGQVAVQAAGSAQLTLGGTAEGWVEKSLEGGAVLTLTGSATGQVAVQAAGQAQLTLGGSGAGQVLIQGEMGGGGPGGYETIALRGPAYIATAQNGGDPLITFDGGAGAPQPGDVVLYFGGRGNSAGSEANAWGPITADYEEIKTVTGAAMKVGLWKKEMGATPDTEVQGAGGGGMNQGAAYLAYVLDGSTVDPDDLLDALVVDTGYLTGALVPDAPAIETATPGAWVAAHAVAGNNDSTRGDVANYTLLNQGVGIDSQMCNIAAVYREIVTPGVEDPPAWSEWAGQMRGAITIAIRPKALAGGGPALTLSGSGSGTVEDSVATLSGAATLLLSSSGAGTVPVVGAGAASLEVQSSAAGQVLVQGEGAAVLSFGAAGAGKVAVAGAGVAQLGLSGAAAGVVLVQGAGTAVLSLISAGTGGSPAAVLAGTAVLSFSSSGISSVLVQGSGQAQLQLSWSSTGRVPAEGQGGTQLTLQATAAGRAIIGAVGAGQLAEAAGSGTGAVLVQGAGLAVLSFSSLGSTLKPPDVVRVDPLELLTGGADGEVVMPGDALLGALLQGSADASIGMGSADSLTVVQSTATEAEVMI